MADLHKALLGRIGSTAPVLYCLRHRGQAVRSAKSVIRLLGRNATLPVAAASCVITQPDLCSTPMLNDPATPNLCSTNVSMPPAGDPLRGFAGKLQLTSIRSSQHAHAWLLNNKTEL
jgi:hypothetical protein